MKLQKILGIDTNEKTVKGEKYGYLTGIVYLAPANESGAANVCPNASEGCKAACLFTAGRGRGTTIRNARIKKTLNFLKNKQVWMQQLINEIKLLIDKSKRQNMTPCVRLNGTSDLPWERIKSNGKTVMEHYPDVQFYDYTKSKDRMMKYLKGEMPTNYHLTFSRSETNQLECEEVLNAGGNVAVVFEYNKQTGALPPSWQGYTVIDGDQSDLRFTDPKNVVVGLSTKGRATKDKSGFVVRV